MQESWGDETTDRERHKIGATDFFFPWVMREGQRAMEGWSVWLFFLRGWGYVGEEGSVYMG